MLDAFEGVGQARAGEHVALARVAFAGAAAAERAHVVTAREQRVDELGTDVAGRSSDKDGIRLTHVIGYIYPGALAGNPDRARRRRLSRATPVKRLAIKDLAEQTGVAAGTIRMWEQRYGFPEPERTAAGYRVYTEQDVVALRRVVAYRSRGLSVPAALERARSLEGPTDRPSIFAALASGEQPVRPQRLRRPTLIALSRAIEEEAMARAAGPVVIAAFQAEANYRAVEHRYRRLAHVADAVGVFATFDAPSVDDEDEPAEIPITTADALGHEWAVVVDAPGYAACLVGWETPDRDGDTDLRGGLDDGRRRRAPRGPGRRGAGGAQRAGVVGAAAGDRSPTARSRSRRPTPGLTALTNRMIGYLDASQVGRMIGAAAASSYGRGIRSIVRLSTRPPTVKPICANSPAARIVVVTSSVPVGAPIGFGGGSHGCAARSGGRRGTHGLGPRSRAGVGGGRARLRRRPRRLRVRRAFWPRAARPADALRAARGQRAEHALLLALGLRFALRSLLRHRGSSVRLDRSALAWRSSVLDDRPTARAALAQRRIRDRLQTAGGSRQSMRLDSATTAVGEGGPNARFRSRQAHIRNGRLSAEPR